MATGISTTPTASSPLVDFSKAAVHKIARYALVIALGSFLFGYNTGVVSGALLFIKHRFDLDAFQQGTVVSVLLLGAIVGSLFAGRVADAKGRRATLGLISIIFALGIGIAALANSYAMLIVGRVIMGLGVGAVSALVPTYLSEISPPQIRGRVMTISQLGITSGLLVSYLVDLAFAGAHDWRAMFAVGLIPALALAIGTLFLPESPSWLLDHGKEPKARSEIAAVAGDEAAEKSIARYKRDAEERQRAGGDQQAGRKGYRMLLKPSLRAAMVVGLTLAVLQQFVGINTIMYYAPTIMQRTGLSTSNSILYSVFIGIINFGATIVSMRLIDRLGRRALLLISLVGMLVSLAALGLSFVASLSPVVTLLFILLYIVAFAIGMGPVFWILLGEIFPPEARAAGASAGSNANWTSNFLVSLVFLPIINAIGTGETFWAFGVVCAFGLWFVSRYVPETRDREFPDVDKDLQARWKGGVSRHAASHLPRHRRATS
jgi:SP family galactose:H+ symporter-like MFS transporter